MGRDCKGTVGPSLLPHSILSPDHEVRGLVPPGAPDMIYGLPKGAKPWNHSYTRTSITVTQ